MITAKFSVQAVDKGWAVRIGPDVLVRSPTKGQALLQADSRAAAIRSLGGRAIVVEETQAAFESVAVARPPGNLGLQVTLSNMPGAPRRASKGNG
jgi:hypothetical protein